MDSEINIRRLDNGFTIALERLPYLHSATFGVWIKTGSAAEKPEEAGIAHFLEHLFFKGTHTRNVHQIMDAIEKRGGYINASTSREYTVLYVRMLEEYVEEGIEILGDILLNSTFRDINKERGVILEEITSTEDTPEDFSHDLLSEHHWPNHPLGRPISGYIHTVSKLKKKDFRRFYDLWYKPENMVFSIAGNFNEGRVISLLEKLMGHLPNGKPPAFDITPAFNSGSKWVNRPISQSHIGLAFPGSSATDIHRYDCNLLAGILGGGGTSRLFEVIREREGLAYSIYSYHADYSQTGMLGIYSAVAPQNCKRALHLIFKELQRIRDEKVEEEELNRNKQQIKGAILMALESTYTRMSRMAKGLMFKGYISPIEEIIAHIEAVTPERIMEYANQRLHPDTCALLVLGPEEKNFTLEIDL